jgi:hypothetical protein
MKSKKPLKSSSTAKGKTKPKAGTTKSVARKILKKRASQKMISAASKIKKTTKKIIDDVFLKWVGDKVLARAEEVTKTIKKEKRAKGKK